VEHVESAALRRALTGVIPLAALSLLLLASLFMMSAATQNSALFGRMYSVLLVINLLGIVLLIALIVLNVMHLVEQYRARVLGSRLTLRLLMVFVVLSVIPVSVVFVFSVQTLHRGIDNWFDVRIEKALDDALLLGRTSLEALRQELLKHSQDIALDIGDLSYTQQRPGGGRTLLSALNNQREQYNISELTLFSSDGRIIASSSDAGPEAGASLLPPRPGETILSQVRQGLPYANLDAVGDSDLRLRVVVPVYAHDVGAPLRFLQSLQALPPRYAKLGESVQSAFAEYEKLVYLRGPLKFGFTLSLSLVALLTMLVAVWAAMFVARRLVAPIRDLAEGTRAVAQGDYRKQLPVTSHDELGVLVESFNDMTRRIQRAQSQTKRSQQVAEVQRTYLETVLTHLSSGVLSFDPRHRLRTHNAAAAQILAADLEFADGKTVAWISRRYEHLQPLTAALSETMEAGRSEWRAEVTLSGSAGPRRLMLRGTRLPGLRGRPGGYVIVFDDVTTLIQAQRDAAWGEVARRMAHEIKNPLTPIQLSAERIRHKYLKLMPEEERKTLDRATRTIVDQVDSLKTMVNAFSEYARPAPVALESLDLNNLVRDVMELYKNERTVGEALTLRPAEGATGAKPIALELDLGARLPALHADPRRLRQVLHNLVINARDALTAVKAPVFGVRTALIGDKDAARIELQVEDNGPGFPETLMAHLFEPYVTSKEKGTGLGLAIVKRIIEEHAGTIVAENLARGGARVTIHLPAGNVAALPHWAEKSA
jgi:two-component system, NtrC family, nitrogen regulation sensor histidine kinase NtrY